MWSSVSQGQLGTMLRCRAAGCTENHAKRYCRVCRTKDSDHRAMNCPTLTAKYTSGRCVGYHQTSPDRGQQITQSGVMQPSASGAAGCGIYFAIRPNETQRKAHNHGCMVTAEISLRRPKHVWRGKVPNVTYESLAAEGYDGVIVHGFRSGVEVVVYKSEQVRVLSVQDM
ncbi:unnamed protein product [Vitrella brassicaformis CCMP3155]|uniref:PARP catalytic domain-containing protein n=1 Tax=Vitrella brassicaformis (strain CCMP3155) TaxID=1169540 RepID=A0A0G4GMC7_VITBC|nr:unnamed protein product [Vitrella brassicaformis CCMP3155]|eukprot:CEM31348.1 unnamed protein product [Vitrella brassicaformis CCMP3155]